MEAVLWKLSLAPFNPLTIRIKWSKRKDGGDSRNSCRKASYLASKEKSRCIFTNFLIFSVSLCIYIIM